MKPKLGEMLAGIFVLSMVAVFMLFLSWMSDSFSWINPTTTAVTYYESIGALQTNVGVTYQGVPIGSVTRIDLEKNSTKVDPPMDLIRVTMQINESFANQLPKKAIAMVTQASALGDPYIEITSHLDALNEEMYIMGDPTVRVENGIIIFDAVNPSSLGELLARATVIMDDFRNFTKHMDEYADTVGNILEGAEELVADEAFIEDVHATVADARQVMVDAKIAIRKLPKTMNDASAFMKSARHTADRIDSLVAASEDTFATIINNVDELTFNAKVLTYGLAESPWRVVWKDKEWQKRVTNRDPRIINASLKKPAEVAPSEKSMDEAVSGLKPTRKNRNGYN